MTYTDYDELFRLLAQERRVGEEEREAFLRRNSWEALARTVWENVFDLEVNRLQTH